MKNYRIVTALILAFVLVFASLAGCGSSATDPSNTASSETSASKESQDTEAPSSRETETTAPSSETEGSSETESASEPETSASEEVTSEPSSPDVPLTDINIGVLKGPTGMGAIKLLDESENGLYPNYHFTLTPEVTDIVARLSNGDLDIGALPTNVAANLYNKTSGGVKLIALNCLGVLYVLENGNSVNSVEDLRGRTIYTLGRGSNPEFMINFVLQKNGLTPGTDVTVEFADASEIATKMITGEIDLCMLPVPAVTTILMKNENVRKALDMTEEYDKAASDGSVLTMGCLVAKTSFIEEHPEAVRQFLQDYQRSVEDALADTDTSAELIAKYEITGNAQIAKNAIPDASIVCITGEDLRSSVEGYFQVLYDADPVSVGGAMPGDDFYYTGG